METVYLYNESFSVLPRIKRGLKGVLGKEVRGPEAVFAGLVKGLTELGVDYKINQKPISQIQTVCVVSGIKTLKWAIEQKKLGKLKKIMAGPNLVIAPTDRGGILKSPLINRIIVPSLWVEDFYIKSASALAGKISVWPAGVDVPRAGGSEKSTEFLIYNKLGKGKLFFDVSNYLKHHKFKFGVVDYGRFKQQEYFKLLESSRYLIYLSESESQGLAMFEAWARNVPVLVWDKGFFEHENVRVEGNVASPYLREEAGGRFRDFREFQEILKSFLQTAFKPKEYIEKNFTFKIAAENFLKVLNDE